MMRIWLGEVCVRRSMSRLPSRSVVDPERVPHVAGRVIGGDAQRLEVVVVPLDLGPLGDLEAHVLEGAQDVAQGLRDRVETAEGERRPRQSDVQPLALDEPARRGLVRVMPAVASYAASSASFERFASAPTVRRSSMGRVASPRKTAVSWPLRPRYARRHSSSCAASDTACSCLSAVDSSSGMESIADVIYLGAALRPDSAHSPGARAEAIIGMLIMQSQCSARRAGALDTAGPRDMIWHAQQTAMRRKETDK